MLGLGLWCLVPLLTIFQLNRSISFIRGENRSTRTKPPTCRKSLRDFLEKKLKPSLRDIMRVANFNICPSYLKK